MNPIIEVSNVTRTYRLPKNQKKTALNGISFTVNQGEVFGLLGPNGAGKTTTMKILTTLLTPTTGSVSILGNDVIKDGEKIRKSINFVYGGERGVYGRLTAFEYMSYFCTLYKIKNKEQKELIENLLLQVGLAEASDQKIHTYSKGMIQRLHIARSLINEPKILFLDEPTIGLDPIGAKMLRELVKTLSNQGITIILTTHYMHEADELCDRIAFIKNGEITLIGVPEQIKEECNHLHLYEATMNLHHEQEINYDSLLQTVEIDTLRDSFKIVRFEVHNQDLTLSDLEEHLSKYGEVLRLRKREITLEDAYIHHMKDVG
ncbi:ABC transporter ATP-binding protein [Fredinandcohnia sp. 179-A 10B2 NHS]|uniref:ABC transporter ATP-binding protein n=1 Tax=Fredinandcohnia sp. 179-A 10B2 NHS TaxID=3235176 RepID=UPI00399FF3A6